MSQKSLKKGKKRKKRGDISSADDDVESTTLEHYFAIAASENICCVCGKSFKRGQRLTHEKHCRLRPDDDDVIFVEEVKATTNQPDNESAVPSDEPTRPARKKKRQNEQKHGSTKELPQKNEEIVPQPKHQPWSKRLRARRAIDDEEPGPVASSSFSKAPAEDGVSSVADGTTNAKSGPDTAAERCSSINPKDAADDNDLIIIEMDDHSQQQRSALDDDEETSSIDLFLTAETSNNADNTTEESQNCGVEQDERKLYSNLPRQNEELEENENDHQPSTSITSASSVKIGVGIPVITSVRTIASLPAFPIFSQFGPSQMDASVVGFSTNHASTLFAAPAAADDDVDDDEIDENDDEGDRNEKITPFALKAFRDIVARVYNDDFHAHLFDENDKSIIESFMDLPSGAQLLFCRLMTRKRGWIPLDSLKKKYGMTLDVESSMERLSGIGLLDSGDKMEGLKEALSLLSAVQLRTIAKVHFRMNITAAGAGTTTKRGLIEEIMIFSKGQSSLSGSMEKTMIKRPDDMASANLADGRMKSIANLISNVIHVLRQKHADVIGFPARTGIRQYHQFRSREEMRAYVRVNILEADMRQALTKGRYEECLRINDEALQLLTSLIVDDQQEAKYGEVVSHFRKYTPPWVLFRIAACGVDVLERERKYEQAVTQLRTMIGYAYDRWCSASRSKWYERLALDLNMHLKKPTEALEVIESAWKDKSLADDTRLNLHERAQKITKLLIKNAKTRSAKAALSSRLHKLEETVEKLLNIPNITIDGKLLNKALGGRNKTIFATKNSQDGSVTARNVEEVAKRHYVQQEGFTEGIHGEGSPWLCLFGLFFWEIIHDPNVPDAFICSQQWSPQDLNDPKFYARRKTKMDEKMDWIKHSSLETRLTSLRQAWSAHRDKASELVKWRLFDDFSQIERIVTCISPDILSRIFERLVSKYRSYRSGFPDLLLWNYEKRTFKVVEVKGPGDRLSQKQRLWLDYFVKIGAKAEVCWVNGVSGKRLQKVP